MPAPPPPPQLRLAVFGAAGVEGLACATSLRRAGHHLYAVSGPQALPKGEAAPDAILVDLDQLADCDAALPPALLAGPTRPCFVFIGSLWRQAQAPRDHPLLAHPGLSREFLRADAGELELEALAGRLLERRLARETSLALAEDLEKAEREVAACREAFVELSERLSHELQAAFRAIARATEGLELPGADPAASLQLQRIVQTARQGHAVVRDLVTLSRIQVATLAWTSVDLADVVRRCAADLAPAAPGVAWQVGPLPAVAGDRSLLDLAVRQLLDNAVKFSRGTTAPRVEVEALADSQGWTIEVRDTGVGFDEASRHRLFQPLEHVHRRSDLQGSGVGLAMVRAAVERHGGRVAARLRPGGGAVFSFWLPASPPIESDDERAISAGAQDPDADLEWDDALLPLPLSASDPLRILLVDDDPLVRITLQAVLEHEGHAVVTLATAEAALAALRGATIPFDALLTDWSLPGMEGPQLALEARACHRSTRTILLTGQTTKMGLDIVPAGVDCVLAKPVRAAELRDALARGRPEERPEAAA